MILAAVLTVMGAATALAQGIVVNKTDGSKVYFKASEVVSVTTYGYGEDGPHAPAGAEAVDLGLPSGTKWACCNVDTDHPEKQSPTNYGGYYAWGETETKSNYSESAYQYYKSGSYQSIGSDIAGTKYDVAHVKWGGSWVMPSAEQQDELIFNCTNEWTSENGVIGRKFTSKKNGKSIFLPAAGCINEDGIRYDGLSGSYWSSMPSQRPSYEDFFAYDLGFSWNWEFTGRGNVYRYYGFSVRPVSR